MSNDHDVAVVWVRLKDGDQLVDGTGDQLQILSAWAIPVAPWPAGEDRRSRT
jgi:hypothetical protein